MRKVGKYTKKWLATRRAWIKQNPPDFDGYYYCYLCHKAIKQNEMTLDHIIPRSRRPDLRYDFENLRPCCWECNYKKGSKIYESMH